MKKHITSPLLLLACSLTFLLSGCSNAPPNCSDGNTLKVLNSIITKHFVEQGKTVNGKAMQSLVNIEIRSIKTLEHDKELGSYGCSAKLEFRLKSDKKTEALSNEIEYQVYSVEDRENSFEVTVLGVTEAHQKLFAKFFKGANNLAGGWK